MTVKIIHRILHLKMYSYYSTQRVMNETNVSVTSCWIKRKSTFPIRLRRLHLDGLSASI